MIEVIGLSKGYGRRRVLNNLSFRVRPGELALLVGANGCGKSTTLRLLAGLSSADGGRMLLSGRDVAADPARGAGRRVLPAAVAALSPAADCRADPRVLRAVARPAGRTDRDRHRTLGAGRVPWTS